MGSKRSAKVPSEKKDDDEAKKLQQKRMSWKLKYELINSDQLFVNGTEEGKSSSGEEEQQEGHEQCTEKNKIIEEEKKTDVKKKESKQKTTVLAGLSGYLSSSDSDDSESSDQEPDIQVEVRAFLKEIDGIKLDSSGNPIAEPEEKKEEQKRSSESAAMDQQQQAMREYYASHGYTMPTSSWQECYDSSSGYSYYWNIDTNEVRWDIPAEYQVYIATVKRQWEEYNRALYANQYRSTSSMALNQSAGNSAAGSVPVIQTALTESVTNKDATQSALRHSQTQIPSTKSPGKVKRRPSHLSDSEDEKIELITSYGPNSDDQSSEDDSQINEASKTKKKKRHSLDAKSKDSESGPVIKAGASITAEELEKQEELKKKLASRQEDVKKLLAIKKEEALRNKKRLAGSTNDGPSNKKQAVESELISTVSNAPAEEKQNILPVPCKPDLPSDNVPSPGEFELVERLKSQAEVLKQLGGELPEGVYNIISDNINPKIENDASLVPGYEEDADSESDEKEFIDEDSNESKSVKSEISEESNSKNIKDDTTKQDGKQVAAAGERVSKRVLKLSAKAKQLINASETTKRARQTDFVSTPLGLRPANSAEIVSDQNVEEKASLEAENDTQRIGLGYFEDTADTLNTNKIVKFVSGGSTKDSADSVDSGSDVDIEDRKEVLMGKMKFLSEGKDAPSPVQIWAEQLEILYKAWEGKWLKDEFLSRWLQNISERLTQLESTAAPPGWLCLWSREERRYCYKRVETGEVVWDFPVATLEEPAPAGSPADTQPKPGEKEEITDLGDGQGEIEMDLCMTPPPPSTPPSPPPPPVISIDTPSPPPPPVISYPPDKDENVPPLPEDIAPPLPEEAPPPLPEEAPPLPLDDVPPLPPGEPLPPGLEPPHPELSFTPPLPPAPSTPPILAPAPSPQPHRTLLPHPTSQDYSHIVMTPATYHHMAYHPMQHYGTQSQYSSAYVSAAPMPAQIPVKPVETENKPSNLSSELNSFYSDLATLEPEETEEPIAAGIVAEETPPVGTQDSPEPPPTSSSPDPNALKKRKKTKLAPGLALKKKGVSSLVAKWQKVQQNSRRDF